MTSYQLAPEWARQDAVILVWPHKFSDWGKSENGYLLGKIEKTYIELCHYIARNQKIVLVAYDQFHFEHIQFILSSNNIDLKNITFIEIASNDTWVRDYGPICVQGKSGPTILNFSFDAWGGKYSHEKDNIFNTKLKELLNLNSELLDIATVLEAGNIEVNNNGCLLSSSDCFKRNNIITHTDLPSLEKKFREWFGCEQIFWINTIQLAGDDTDGHIDNLVRFCTDEIILYSAPNSPKDINKISLTSLAKQLQNIKLQQSNNFELIPLQLPTPISNNTNLFPASYVNFLITNNNVLVPVFNDKHDNQALKIIDECFPSHEIIDIESTALIQQLGGIHCATMQIPYGFLT